MTKVSLVAKTAFAAAAVALSSPAFAAAPCPWLSNYARVYISIDFGGESYSCVGDTNNAAGDAHDYFISTPRSSYASCKSPPRNTIFATVRLKSSEDDPSECRLTLAEAYLSSVSWGSPVRTEMASSTDNEVVVTGLNQGGRRGDVPWVMRIRPGYPAMERID